MANVLINENSMTAIANAIRAKNGTSTTYKPSEMAGAISAIDGGGSTPTGTIQITSNGTHDVSAYASANVAVPTGSTPTGTKQISITSNGTTTEDVSAYANAEITVNVQSGGSGGGMELLAEYTLTEDVEVVNIPCTTAMQNRDFYLMEVTGSYERVEGSAAAIFSASLNGATSKPYNGVESGNTIHKKIGIAKLFTADGNSFSRYSMIFTATGAVGQTLNEQITTFDFKWYNTGYVFKAGTIMRVYGASA